MSVAAAAARRSRFTLPPAHEAGAPPEARGLERDEVRLLVAAATAPRCVHDTLPRPARRTCAPATCSWSTPRRRCPRRSPPRAPDGTARRPAPLHAGARPRRPRRRASTRTGSSSCAAPARASAPPAPASGSRCPAAARPSCSRSYLSPGRLWVARARPAGAAAPPTWPSTGARSPTATCARPRPLRDLPDRVRRRAGQRRDAERRPPVHAARARRAEGARASSVAPLVLHTGVASLERGERPYPERYRVPADHRQPRQRPPRRGRPRDRRRHDRRARARDGRGARRRASRRAPAGPA